MLPCTATESDCTSTALFADPRLSGVPLAGAVAMAMVEIAPFTEFHTFAKHKVDSTHLLKWARDPRNRFSRRFLPQQRRLHALATRRASVGGQGCQSQPRVPSVTRPAPSKTSSAGETPSTSFETVAPAGVGTRVGFELTTDSGRSGPVLMGSFGNGTNSMAPLSHSL